MWRRFLTAPIDDYLAGLEACLQTRRWWSLPLIAAGAIASWFVYVPIHELLHAFGCLATGGTVTRLEIDAIYGAAFLQRFFPWVAVGSEYAGQLTGFDTHGSDLVYLATDLAPFTLTVLIGVPLLRAVTQGAWPPWARHVALGAAMPVAYAPFISFTGDYYEMASLLVSRLAAWLTPGFDVQRWRSDDVFKLLGQLQGQSAAADYLGVTAALLIGGMLALGTYALGGWLAHRVVPAGDRPSPLSPIRQSTDARRSTHRHVGSSWLLIVWLACGLNACGDDGENGTMPASIGEPIRFQPAEDGVTRFGDVPWPSDLYRSVEGVRGDIPGLELVAAMPERLAAGLGEMDGFGRSTGALFFLDAEVDPRSLPRTWEQASDMRSAVLIVDVDPASPHAGTRYPAYAKFLPSLQCISVIPVPGIVVRPGRRAAAVVTTRVRTADGLPLVASDELRRIASLPAARRETAAEELYGSAIDALLAHRVVTRRDEIAGLAVFTTSSRVFEMPRLRSELYAEAEPELLLGASAQPYTAAIFGVATTPSLDDWLGDHPERDEQGRPWPGGDNPGGIAHDEIGAVVSGAFVAPSFLDRASRRFRPTLQVADASTKVPVTLVIPRRPPPAAGYPVVIHGHGLSNHRGSMLGVANELARAGFVMIGIDDVLHGSRQGIRDVMSNFGGAYRGPDGIPDGVGLPIQFFGGFVDFVVMRDNFRQTVLDHSSLVRLIRSSRLDLSPLAEAVGGFVPRLDAERIYWSGGSLGGIIGAMATATEPEIAAAALHVPGASFIQLITTTSAELAPLVGNLAGMVLGLQGSETLDEFHPAATLLGAVTEAGDPIAYASHVLREPLLPQRTPPDILLTYAVHDEVLPNLATVALIRALGIPLAAPFLFELPGIATAAAPLSGNLPGGRTGAAVQYYPANHGLGYARYDYRQFFPDLPRDGGERFPRLPQRFRFELPVREHLAQSITFFESVATAPLGRIEVTVPPLADFDADGVTDDEERAQGTNPYDPMSR
jgi:hypothetical protein